MKIKLALLTLTLLTGHLVSTASAIVTAPGFQTPDPSAPNNAQLSGLNSINSYFGSTDTGTFVAWEKFSAGTFSGLAHQYSGNNGQLSATLSQTLTGPTLSTSGSNPGHINVGGVDYYGRLMTGPYGFTIDATSLTGGGLVTLAIKHTPFFDVDFNPIPAFSATLNGITLSEPTFTSANFGNYSDPLTMAGTAHYYVFQWQTDIAANDPFSISFASGVDQLGFGFSIDAIALSVQPIPEPSTFALLGAGLLGGLYLKRRRAA